MGRPVSRLVVTGDKFHRYSLDGKRVPNVTGVTGKAVAKPALVAWAARETATWAATHVDELDTLGEAAWITNAKLASDRVRDASMIAGKQLHSIAERMIYGEPVEPYDPDTGNRYDDDVWRMGEQVARFLDTWQVDPDDSLVECPVWHATERYAGRFDLVGKLRGGDRWLVDYKTGASGVWPETALQATAYARATHVVVGELDEPMPRVDRCAALWVRPDAWELVPVKSDEATWNAFRYCLRVAAWLGQPRDDIVGAPYPVPEVA